MVMKGDPAWGQPVRTMFKPARTAGKVAKVKARVARVKKERDQKAEVRTRDKFCRFPLCGCRKLGLALAARPEVSHDKHKGSGGNPSGDRSVRALMIYLCLHRHQDSAISRHKGTLRTVYLTAKKNDGPVAWEVETKALLLVMEKLKVDLWVPMPGKAAALARLTGWVEIARERKVQQLEDLEPWQRTALEALAGAMEL